MPRYSMAVCWSNSKYLTPFGGKNFIFSLSIILILCQIRCQIHLHSEVKGFLVILQPSLFQWFSNNVYRTKLLLFPQKSAHILTEGQNELPCTVCVQRTVHFHPVLISFIVIIGFPIKALNVKLYCYQVRKTIENLFKRCPVCVTFQTYYPQVFNDIAFKLSNKSYF